MDMTLLSVLVKHHNNNDHAQNGWKPHDTCDVDITKENITGRIKTFDKQYETITKMFAHSVFGWDWEKNMVSVDSDEVWSRYVEANKVPCAYRNKVVHNWESINTIYSKDHATGADTPVVEESSELPKKTQCTGDAILCMMGQMKMYFDDALKTTKPLPMPKVAPPSEIFDALKKVLELDNSNMLKSFGILIINERLFEGLMVLPEEFRNTWLLNFD
ncbi:hypothetical protein ZWY2020_009396 [Hordeum vulgare]|nr:hypothetical protein ZWY2020_009396 [Hordeum vulgare]